MAEIITFYSYKGGTGRSFAVANIAWLLASSDRRVLVIDWDLEAPGLHYYFRPFLPDPSLRGYGVHGIIDAVLDYATEAVTPPADPARTGDRRAGKWVQPFADVSQHAVVLRWPTGSRLEFGTRGSISFLPSGRQDALYSTRVNTFNWKHLYEDLNGHAYFEAMRESFGAYDYVLIDSRTGVSDTSGICTIQMPHKLLLCFTLNNQSITGAASVAGKIAAQRPDLPIFPAAFRVDGSERDRVNARREYAQKTFNPLLARLRDLAPQMDLDGYWRRVEIPYFPIYAYEEILSPFEQFSERFGSLLPAFQELTGILTYATRSPQGPPAAEQSAAVVKAYRRPPSLAEEEVDEPGEARGEPASDLAVSTAVLDYSTPAKAGRPWNRRFPILVFVCAAIAAALGLEAWQAITDALPDKVTARALWQYAGMQVDRHNLAEASGAIAAAADLPLPHAKSYSDGEALEVARQMANAGVSSIFVPGRFSHCALNSSGTTVVCTKGDQVWIQEVATGVMRKAACTALPDASIQFSPDGSLFALVSGSSFSLCNSGKALFNDVVFGAAIKQVIITADNNTLAVLAADYSSNHRYTVTSYRAPFLISNRSTFGVPATGNFAALSGDASAVPVVNFPERNVTVWRVGPTRDLIAKTPLTSAAPRAAAFNPNLTRLVLISESSAQVLDLSTGAVRAVIPLHRQVTATAVSAFPDQIAIGDTDGKLTVYRDDGTVILQITGPNLPVGDVNITPDGRFVSARFGSPANSSDSVADSDDFGFYVWKVRAHKDFSHAEWPEVAAEIKTARGNNCLSVPGRQSVFGDTPQEAANAYRNCMSKGT
jgi:hypothetical protein